MTFRFEEENYKTIYILEDFYFTNPFTDDEYMVVSFRSEEDANRRISFILDFKKTHRPLPNMPKMPSTDLAIVKNFTKEIPDDLMTLFKQRAMEAKAYGEKNPLSYLEFSPDRYMNFIELYPSNKETIKFSCNNEKYFAEDSYNIDPREKNRDLKLTFFKVDLNDAGTPPILEYTYYFDENQRGEEDSRLDPEKNDMVLAMNAAIPNLFDILKKRYREAKDMGEKLMQSAPSKIMEIDEKADSNQVLN
jgi:hypothetical protein